MTIRIKCPHCQKALGVKDHLAGKKVACPVCKKSLKIPAPVSAAADVEDLAAAALADAPKPAEPVKENKPIEFTCSFCDAQVKVAFELGGKQTPCPECKRIVKVPKPVEDKPKDWRTVDGGNVPSFARQAEPQAPDGAWAPAAARKVSQQALAEAGAVPEIETEPVGIGVWIRRGAYAAAAIGAIVMAWVWLANRRHEGIGREGLTKALEFIEPKSKLGPEASAAIYRAAGEFYAHKPDAKKAQEHFGKARAWADKLPEEGPAAIDRDVLLREIALAWVDLGGSDKDVEDGKRASWASVQKELERTLLHMNSLEARAWTLGDIVSRLLENGKDGENAALGLANKVTGPSDQAVEIITAQQMALALLLARGNAEQAAGVPARPGSGEITDLTARLTYAESLAREGKYADARQLADQKGDGMHRLSALLRVAAIAMTDKNPTIRAENARPAVEKAFEVAWPELKKGKKLPPWDLIALGCLAARTGLKERVQEVLARLPDKTAMGRVQLELVLAQVEGSKDFLDPSSVTLPDKESLSHGLALEALARHNTRVGRRSAVLESVEALEENLRAFVFVGVALGEEDASRR